MGHPDSINIQKPYAQNTSTKQLEAHILRLPRRHKKAPHEWNADATSHYGNRQHISARFNDTLSSTLMDNLKLSVDKMKTGLM